MDPSIEKFRVLVVDDEKHTHEVISEDLETYAKDLQLDFAFDADEAEQLLKQALYDLAIVDLYGKDDLLIGTEIIRRIDAADLATRVILMSKFELNEDSSIVLTLTGSRSAWRLAGFLDKRENFSANVRGQVGLHLEYFRSRRAAIEGLEQIVSAVKKQRHRYKNENGEIVLRGGRNEIAAEVDRLIRKLYVELPGDGERTSRVSVALDPVESPGLSAAVVVSAGVEVRFEQMEGRVGARHTTILKVGPKPDILEEAARYAEYVRYGVPLANRVELQAVAGMDAIGGLVYSFAGGLYNNEVLSLDRVLIDGLERETLSMSESVVRSLFATRYWYGIDVGEQDVSAYFGRNYRTSLAASIANSEKHLFELAERRPNTGISVRRKVQGRRSLTTIKSSDGFELVIPDKSVLGWGPLLHGVPGCLVHGDMHGGNVLLERAAPEAVGDGTTALEHYRTCLIDFRNAGPGPRTIDASCLASTIRFADAESAARLYPGSAGDGDLPAGLANAMIRRAEADEALYRAVFLHQGSPPEMGWAKVALIALEGLLECFPDLTLREYLTTNLRYTIRALGFPLSDLVRLRMTAWLSAQYSLARELELES